jgi:signal transduction histidine kinase
MTHWFNKWLPRTLFARLTLILFASLVLAHGLSYWIFTSERGSAARTYMIGYMELDVASSVALLDRLPAEERPQWLERLRRPTYAFVLGHGTPGTDANSLLSMQLRQAMQQAIGPERPLMVESLPDSTSLREHLQMHTKLSDGSLLTIDLHPKGIPLSSWITGVLGLQLALLAALSWLCVRLATQPLEDLAKAADSLGPDLKPNKVAENGPAEVARAAIAFNAMQERIANYTAERMQILAAISHDLQTPITRMRLRADLMDDEEQRAAQLRGLKEMEDLVREGVTFARTLHGATETPRQLDLDALLDSMVCDYTDAGQDVSLRGSVGENLLLRPVALRRILANLTDNALKFGGSAELEVAASPHEISISVLDRGPGIPQDKLETVFQPFYRLEGSRNRDSGGTGLGLTIARQLAQALDGKLELSNRDGGGLSAKLTLPRH